jgi:hypothetical protein
MPQVFYNKFNEHEEIEGIKIRTLLEIYPQKWVECPHCETITVYPKTGLCVICKQKPVDTGPQLEPMGEDTIQTTLF